MGISLVLLAAWLHEKAGIRAKVLYWELETSGGWWPRAVSAKKAWYGCWGVVSQNAGIMTLSYGNPKTIQIPVFAPSSLSD